MEVKKNENFIRLAQANDEASELNKQKMVEKIIQKWLLLQKTIKEEITLEDVILRQQNGDFNHIKNYFREYYKNKLISRKTLEDIKKLNQNENNTKEMTIVQNEDKILKESYEPIKNLLFIFRNNYDYIIKLVSLISESDDEDNIESLVELFCNQFYDNILIPNPEQEELLILIYKLLEEEITPMNSASIDEFLSESTFLGKFISSYMKRQELNVYLSMLLNPLILSIEKESDECLNMSLFSIKDYVKNKEKAKSKQTDQKNELINNDTIYFDCKKKLFDQIPKTRIKFKKNFELEAEKEEESKRINSNDYMENEQNCNEEINQNENNEEITRNSDANTSIITNNEEDYNNDYMEQLTVEELNSKIKEEKNKDIKDFYVHQLEQTGNDYDIFSNKGLLEVLGEECFKDYKTSIVERYRYNFLFIQKKIDRLIQSLIDKISTIPYTVRCICKIISLLMSKKFPLLPKFLRNSFIGKFIFDKFIFPVLSLENKNVTDTRIFSNGTKNCLSEIISVLSNANKCLLFNCNTDTEKTIFNYYLLEIIPILNKFYEKVIDIELPKVLDELVSKVKLKMEEKTGNKKNYFKYKHEEHVSNNIDPLKKNITSVISEDKPMYDYFFENSDEILHLQCICFSLNDVLYILSLIEKGIDSFKDLPKYSFFEKTYETLHKNEYKLDQEITKLPSTLQFFVIFRDEKNSQLERLLRQKNKSISSFVSGNQESDLICKRIKFCIKTILKGLNLLNNKDYSYLNMAVSTNKFFLSLKYTLEDIGEFSEVKNKIPLKWYGQYISNNIKGLDNTFQENDYEKLYDEIYNEELNILNELKSFSSIIITRDGMNLRCAEKILEKTKYNLKHIEQAKKFVKLEKFVSTEKIEVCIRNKNIEESFAKKISSKKILSPFTKEKENFEEQKSVVVISSTENCIHRNKGFIDSIEFTKGKKISSHVNYIKDFINKFSDSKDKTQNNISLGKMTTEDIENGERKNQIFDVLDSYMNIVKEKIKKPNINTDIFINTKESECNEISNKIRDHILRQIYKYVYPKRPLLKDKEFYEKTQCLDWVIPEQLEIKKVYINQLGFAELCIKKIDEAQSVFDKIECIRNAHTNMNNTIKFSSGKDVDAGQDELTPIFQYIVIKAQPKRIFSDMNYIKCFLDESELKGEEGFLLTQMESATSFILQIDHKQLKITKEEFDKNIIDAKKRHKIKL